MAETKIDLALAFLKAHPGVAASVLERQALKDVADFLSNIPHSYVAPVLAKMLPQYTARLCHLWKPVLSAGFLAHMDISHTTTVLRSIDLETRQKIVSLFPKKTALACSLLLQYSEDNVGAWMQVQTAAIPIDCSIGEALKRLAEEESTVVAYTVIVVDRQRNLIGNTTLKALLNAQKDAPLASVMQKTSAALRGRTSLRAIEKHEAWAHSDILPVVDKNNQLVGVLRHLDLRKGLEKITTASEKPQADDPISNLLRVYASSLRALFNTVGQLTETQKHRGD